jgi:VIT1/CCC1 family predicted Fe2+/Mn2+ transporter
MWSFDAGVIDGAVNGTGWLTVKWSDIKMWFDKWIIDGAVNGSGWLVRQGSNALRYVQNGSAQFYALFILTMAALIVVLKYVNSGAGWHFDLVWTVVVVVALAALLAIFARVSGKKETAPQTLEREE